MLKLSFYKLWRQRDGDNSSHDKHTEFGQHDMTNKKNLLRGNNKDTISQLNNTKHP